MKTIWLLKLIFWEGMTGHSLGDLGKCCGAFDRLLDDRLVQVVADPMKPDIALDP